MDPLLPPMCLDLSEMIKEEGIGSQREKQGERQGEGKAPVSVEWRKKIWGVAVGGGSGVGRVVVGMRLVLSASQNLWPLSVSASLSHWLM